MAQPDGEARNNRTWAVVPRRGAKLAMAADLGLGWLRAEGRGAWRHIRMVREREREGERGSQREGEKGRERRKDIRRERQRDQQRDKGSEGERDGERGR